MPNREIMLHAMGYWDIPKEYVRPDLPSFTDEEIASGRACTHARVAHHVYQVRRFAIMFRDHAFPMDSAGAEEARERTSQLGFNLAFLFAYLGEPGGKAAGWDIYNEMFTNRDWQGIVDLAEHYAAVFEIEIHE